MVSICPLKRFKDVLGVPGTGAHSIRFLDTAMVDYILTIIVSIVTTYFTSLPLVLTTLFWLILGIILHIIFGVQTNTVKFLNIKC